MFIGRQWKSRTRKKHCYVTNHISIYTVHALCSYMYLHINVKHLVSENCNFCLEDSTNKCTSFLENISIEIFLTRLLTLVPYLHEMKANFTRWVFCESETDHSDKMEENKITFVWENCIVNLIWARGSILGYYTMQDHKFVPKFQTNFGWNMQMLHGVVIEKIVAWATHPPWKPENL